MSDSAQLIGQRLRMPLGALVGFVYAECRRDRVMATSSEFFSQQPPSARALAAAVNQAKDRHDRSRSITGAFAGALVRLAPAALSGALAPLQRRSPNYAALALPGLNGYYDNSILHRRHGDGEARG